MKLGLRSRCGLAAAGTLVAGVGLALWVPWRSRPAFRAQPVPPELRELAVGCIGAGAVVPAVGDLTDAELDAVVEILARLIAAYEHADFDSFLALRRGDLEFAERVNGPRVAELQGVCSELGVQAGELAEKWTELLALYWSAYYRVPPVARFRPETTRLELHREGLGAHSIEAWEEGFTALCAARSPMRIEHRMAVPHRRSLERVAADSGGLRWLHIEVGFEAHDGGNGSLIARFVWDDLVEEWFLHRATTILDEELREDRRQLVL